MAHVIVETTYDQPLTEEAWNDLYETVKPCLKQHGIRLNRSYTSLDRRRVICELEASDTETIRLFYRITGIPFDRAWPAEIRTFDIHLS